MAINQTAPTAPSAEPEPEPLPLLQLLQMEPWSGSGQEDEAGGPHGSVYLPTVSDLIFLQVRSGSRSNQANNTCTMPRIESSRGYAYKYSILVFVSWSQRYPNRLSKVSMTWNGPVGSDHSK